MAVLYNMEPFEVLKILYGSRTDGIPEEDFERNKSERGIEVPQSIKRFLENYAYFSVNQQSYIKLIHPNIMTPYIFTDFDGTKLPLVCVGRTGEFKAAVCEGNVPDPAIFLIKTAGGPVEITLSNTSVFELIKGNIFSVFAKMRGAIIAEEPQQAVSLLRKFDVDLDEIEKSSERSGKFIFTFNEEKQTFIVADLSGGELSRFLFVTDENFINK
ncbi:MAG: hypothetical protein J6C38_04900 [Oscillospiraceae bacterium]|nr:hypothetical protein [Oscillospiraceae bacterium]